jgi:hypothetical protein
MKIGSKIFRFKKSLFKFGLGSQTKFSHVYKMVSFCFVSYERSIQQLVTSRKSKQSEAYWFDIYLIDTWALGTLGKHD